MLLDYVREYGDEPLNSGNVNYLDLLVFAELSNFNWEDEALGLPINQAIQFANNPTLTHNSREARILGSVPNPIEKHMISLCNAEDMKLAEVLADCKRFENVYVLGFDEHFVLGEKQFAGFAVIVDDLTILAFRGTDETATGWHESLNLSLQSPVKSQRDATAFMRDVVSQTTGPIIACGHSKGGSLAVYSSAQLAQDDPEEASRIAAIVSFDGPGMPESIRSIEGYDRISGLISTFIPKSSIVGNVHVHPDGAVTYIESKMPFVAQHYVYNWKTDGSHFVPTSQTLVGRLGSAGLYALVNHLSDAVKVKVIDAIFYIPSIVENLRLRLG